MHDREGGIRSPANVDAQAARIGNLVVDNADGFRPMSEESTSAIVDGSHVKKIVGVEGVISTDVERVLSQASDVVDIVVDAGVGDL